MSTLKFSSWQDLNGNEVANSTYPPGLVLVKTQTIGSGVSSVTVSDAFSSTFDNYKIVVYATASTNTTVRLSLSGVTGASDYDSKLMYVFTYVAGGWSEVLGATTDVWNVGYLNGAAGSTANIEIYQPLGGGRVRFASQFSSYVAGVAFGPTVPTSGTASTGFTLSPGAGTMSGGTIRVYGYNNG